MKIKHQKNIHKFNCFYEEIQNSPEMCHKVIESHSEAWITTSDDQTVGGYISSAGHSIFAVLAIIQIDIILQSNNIATSHSNGFKF